MNKNKIKRSDIDQSLKTAVNQAVKENRALHLSYKKIEDNTVVLVKPNGQKIKLESAKFGMVKVKQKHYTLSNSK